MEFGEPPSTSQEREEASSPRVEDLEVTSNWKIINDKLLHNTISTVDARRSPGRAELEEVVSLETCIRLEGDATEKKKPCSITIKLKDGKKISRIAIVSEAFLIEIYKQFGEYVSTARAEFIDEFEQSAVYFADVTFVPPTPELSIKFARLKNPGEPMWLYGIRLSLCDPIPNKKAEQFNYQAIGQMLEGQKGDAGKPAELTSRILESLEGSGDGQNQELDSLLKNFMSMNMNKSKIEHSRCGAAALTTEGKEIVGTICDSDENLKSDLKTYIDDSFREMERRLITRIDAVKIETNEKLDKIITLLSHKPR